MRKFIRDMWTDNPDNPAARRANDVITGALLTFAILAGWFLTP